METDSDIANILCPKGDIPPAEMVKSWKKRQFIMDYTDGRPETHAEYQYNLILYRIDLSNRCHSNCGVTYEDAREKETVYSKEHRCHYERKKVIIKHNGQVITPEEASAIVPRCIATKAKRFPKIRHQKAE